MREKCHEPFDEVQAMVNILHVIGQLRVKKVQQPRHQYGAIPKIEMPSLWVQEVPGVLLIDLFEHGGQHLNKL